MATKKIEQRLRTQAEIEEQKYFEAAAAEMNADAKDWNTVTSQSAQNGWKKGDNPL